MPKDWTECSTFDKRVCPPFRSLLGPAESENQQVKCAETGRQEQGEKSKKGRSMEEQRKRRDKEEKHKRERRETARGIEMATEDREA